MCPQLGSYQQVMLAKGIKCITWWFSLVLVQIADLPMGYNWTGLGNERGSTSKCTDVACVFQITYCHGELDYNFEFKETNNVENTPSAQMYGLSDENIGQL